MFLMKSAEARDRWMFSGRENCCRIPPADRTVEAWEYWDNQEGSSQQGNRDNQEGSSQQRNRDNQEGSSQQGNRDN